MDESLRIPVEIDISKGLAQMGKFGTELQSIAKTSANAATSSLAKLDDIIDQIGERARETKTQLVNLGNARLPLTSINAYAAAIYKIKQNTAGVSFAPLISGLKNTESAAGAAANALTKVKPGGDQATQSLINLSRVAQDAPYGFLGIANNLNPLLESFQRLKASTGSTGGALKALGSSLTGAGGIGLALGVASSLLVLFGDKLFGTGRKAKEAAKEIDEAYTAAANGLAAQAVKLTSLVGVVQNVNSKYEDKKNALAAINQEYKSYIKNLDLEKVTLDNVALAYDRIVESMLRQAVVKGLQDEITKKVEETAKQIIKIEVGETKRAAAVEKATNADKKKLTVAERARIEQAGYNKVVNDGFIAQQRSEQATVASMGALNNYDAVLKRTKDKLKEELAPLLNLTKSFDDLNISLDKTKEAKDSFNSIISKAKEVAAYLKDSFVITYEFSPLDDKATALKKAQSFLNDVFKGNLKVKSFSSFLFSEPPPAAAIQKTFTDPIADGIRKGIIEGTAPTGGQSISSGMTQEISKKFSKLFAELGAKMPDIDFDLAPSTNEKFLQDELDKAKLEVPVYLNPSIKQGTSFAEAIKQSLIGLNQQFTTLVADLKNNVANAIGDGIGAAAAGGGFESLFQGIIGAVGTAMQQLGKAMIAYGIGMEKLKAAIKSLNPGVAIAAGIGLVALGAIVKSKASKATPFAAGGLVFGPTTGLVGEGTGTNRNNPEVISPLDKLKGFFAGMMNDVAKRTAKVSAGFGGGGVSFSAPQYVELFASGNSLKGVLSLTEQMQNRSF